jgi:phytoene dehydrogenase-like protein
MTPAPDAIVIGSGPNGLAAAIRLAEKGRRVRVYEAEPVWGGGIRSAPLTAPGFTHDVCATVFAVAAASPYFRTLPLERHGVEFVHPDAPFAHPLDDGTAIVTERSIEATAESLDREDRRVYRDLYAPYIAKHEPLFDWLMSSVAGRARLSHPWLVASFGVKAMQSAAGFARRTFSGARARAVFAGAAAHAMLPLEDMATAGYGLALALSAHVVGWPVARGGSQRVADALVAHLQSLGGDVVVNERVTSLDRLPPSRLTLCDITPRQFVAIAGSRLPAGYRRRLEKFRYGMGVFKMDWALSAPVPWRAAACARAGTLHLGGTLDEIAQSERDTWHGRTPARPFVLVVQPTRFDATRAPAGQHTLWAYCHVPHASSLDMTKAIEDQIERFAPGFRDCIVARHAMGPADLERRNGNLVGGDIAGGAPTFAQFFARPVASFTPYRTPVPGVYLCSSSTPPGIGVHGMCGCHAAEAALRDARLR